MYLVFARTEKQQYRQYIPALTENSAWDQMFKYVAEQNGGEILEMYTEWNSTRSPDVNEA